MHCHLLWVDPLKMGWLHIRQFYVPENCDHLLPMCNRLDLRGTEATARPIPAMCHNRPTSNCTMNSLAATYPSHMSACYAKWFCGALRSFSNYKQLRQESECITVKFCYHSLFVVHTICLLCQCFCSGDSLLSFIWLLWATVKHFEFEYMLSFLCGAHCALLSMRYTFYFEAFSLCLYGLYMYIWYIEYTTGIDCSVW